eukprot:g36891.t1
MRGHRIVALDPNPLFTQQTQERLGAAVEVHTTTFEDFDLANRTAYFDAVVAASSFHWISVGTRYKKSSAALRPKGALILLWNCKMEPDYSTFNFLYDIFQQYGLNTSWEGPEKQRNIMHSLAQLFTQESNDLYSNLEQEVFPRSLTYTLEQYLSLLQTYSDVLQLDATARTAMLHDLHKRITQRFGGSLTLYFLTVSPPSRRWSPPSLLAVPELSAAKAHNTLDERVTLVYFK